MMKTIQTLEKVEEVRAQKQYDQDLKNQWMFHQSQKLEE
jgi:hypothetical protein